MYGLLVAIGQGEVSRIRNNLPLVDVENKKMHQTGCIEVDDELLAISYAPRSNKELKTVCWSEDGNIGIMLDGYLMLENESSKNVNETLKKLVSLISLNGVENALRKVISGSFNLLIINLPRKEYSLVNDCMGSIPLYYRIFDHGICFSNYASLLLGLGHNNNIDYTACAEMIFLGYCLRNRHPVKELQQLPQSSLVSWCREEGTSINSYGFITYLEQPSNHDREEVLLDQLASRFKRACNRISKISGKTANLQSAGMDSRLILAAWPEAEPSWCYTYGNKNSYEVEIAKQVANLKGASFTHIRPHGDEVALHLDNIFFSVDMLVYPDRYLISKQLQDSGFNGLLDGYLGDVLLGGTYFSNDKYFNSTSSRLRFITKFRDQKLHKLQTDEIVEALYRDMLTFPSNHLKDFFNEPTAEKLNSQKEEILNDIYEEVKFLSSYTDSCAILFRNYKLSNRGRHAIVKQGVNCRQFLQVYYPFTNDFEILTYALQLFPKTTSYRKLYIKLFKKHFTPYAEIPLGSSKLPLRRSSMSHKWAMILADRGYKIPYLTNTKTTLAPNPNNWAAWLSESELLRKRTKQLFVNTMYCNKEKVEKLVDDFATGEKKGNGKVFHIASVAKWLDMLAP